MDFVTILVTLLLLIWREEDPFIVNLLGNLMLLAMALVGYFVLPWFFNKVSSDEVKER